MPALSSTIFRTVYEEPTLFDGLYVNTTANYGSQKSFSVYREEEKNVVTGRKGDWKLAIWINHVKNPRFRLLELPELDIVINLPKSFALANAAIRLLHQTVNPLYRSKNIYMPLVRLSFPEVCFDLFPTASFF